MSEALVTAAPAQAERFSRRRLVLGAIALAVVALVVLLRAFVAEPFGIPSGSMAPTFRPGDSVLVDKLAYRRTTPARGQLIVFRAPRRGDIEVKRVVAVGGDKVGIEDGALVVNGRRPVEPYTTPAAIDSVYFGPVKVPAGTVFVLGDNRRDSTDSRSFGAVATGDVIGRVRARLWPPAHWGAPR
jgi:signal peptidase I